MIGLRLWIGWSEWVAESRRWWKRLMVGAFVGWVTGSVVGAIALAFVAVDERALPFFASAFVWGGIWAGVCVAYARRPQ